MSPALPPSSPPEKSLNSSLSSPPPHFSSPQLPYRKYPPASESSSHRRNHHHQKTSEFCPSSPIAPSDGLEAALLAALNEAEEEAEDYGGDSLDQRQEFAANQAFMEDTGESDIEESDEESDNNNDEVDSQSEKSEGSGNSSNKSDHPAPSCKVPYSGTGNEWIDDCSTENAKLKLIRIFKGEAFIPKQRWGVDKILATLVQHREDPGLCTPYRQFKRFAYQTMLEELDDSKGRWPSALKRKDWDLIIKLCAQFELEKRYNREIQQLCRTECFGAIHEETPGVDKSPLDNVVETAIEKAPLITSLVVRVGPESSRYSSNAHIVSMKLVAILVILCRSAHRNNSNYIPLLIALYFYSSGARVDAITLLNQFGLSVSYDMLQRKVHSITSMSKR